ncbi:MAG: hypothetical protein KGI80_04510, partial [Verrucomicrobiota bacterium]|nr:hypothetical protein [Verrucomicrobiota bacterium]
PKATILRTVSENPKRGLWFLATLLGVLFLFNIEQSFALGYSISLLPLIALAFFLAPPCGFFVFYILGGAR